MFKLQPDPDFWADVEVKTSNGMQTFKMQFKHLDRVALSAWLKQADGGDSKDVPKAIKKEVNMLMDVCIGWDIKDEEFNKASLETLIKNYVNASTAIVVAYTSGIVGAQIKN